MIVTRPRPSVNRCDESWQWVEFLDRARLTEPFDPDLSDEKDDPADVEMQRQDDNRRSARDLLLVERTREWLLGDEG